MKINIEVDFPTEMIVWQRPDAVKAGCPSTGRLPLLFAQGKSVGVGVYLSYHDEFWFGEEKLKPQEVDWWAKLPLPPGQAEANPA